MKPQKQHNTPQLADRYVNVYCPQEDVYTLPTVTTPDGNITYRQGESYANWRTNDHTFIKGDDNRWHCFGITKPWVAGDNGHAGEGLCFHAVAPEGTFGDTVTFQSWRDLPKISVGDCGWAPVAIKIGQEYSLIGSHWGRTVSRDLNTWTDAGEMAINAEGRDPFILFWENTYYLLYCAGNGIDMVASTDFSNWSEPVTIFKPEKESYQTESPFVVPYEGLFYLFWTLWDTADLSTSGYCPRTYVYCSDSPTDFHDSSLVTEISAHAPEIIQDEAGNWFISSTDYPHRGISVAPLIWHGYKICRDYESRRFIQ